MSDSRDASARTLAPMPATRSAGPEYDDLLLMVEQQDDNGDATVTVSAADRRATAALDLDGVPDDAQEVLEAPGENRKDEARHVGESLWKALLGAPAVAEVFEAARDEATEAGRGLRVLLDLDGAPKLTVLPWELVHDDRGYLGLSGWTPIVRATAPAGPVRDAVPAAPLQIVGMVAAPEGGGHSPIDSVKEREQLEAMLQPLLYASVAEIRWTADGTMRSLREQVAAGSVAHVFHFIGHGSFGATGGSLVFEGADGEPQLVSAEEVGVVLGEARSLRLAVLNACEGARVAGGDRMSGVAGTIAAGGVAAVVGMQAAVSDEAAIEFTGAIYEMVTNGASIEAAVAEGRRAMFLGGSNEWALPTLTMSGRDGRVFQMPTGPVTLRDIRPRLDVEALRRADAAGDAESTFRLAMILGEQGKHEQERVALERADERGHSRAPLVLGTLYAAEHDDSRALAAYRRAAERGEVDGAFNLAHMLKDRGDLSGAEHALRRAIELGSPDAPANLALLLERRGDIAGAEKVLRVGVERDDPAALNNLAGLRLRSGEVAGAAEARVLYARAVDLGSAQAATNLGNLFHEDGDRATAVRLFELADDRGEATAAYNLFVFYTEIDDTERAFLALRRAAFRGHVKARQLASLWQEMHER